MPALALSVNGQPVALDVPHEASLLHVLRNDLQLNGPKYGCGLGQCGACTVHVDGIAARACVIPAHGVAGRAITTLEGLWLQTPTLPASHGSLPPEGAAAPWGGPAARRERWHPVQAAFEHAQAAQCGYCLNGMVMQAAALLAREPHPTEARIRSELSGNLCRCGTHVEILNAVMLVAQTPTLTLLAAQAGDVEELASLRVAAMRESLERIGRFDPVRARERFTSSFDPAFTCHIMVSGAKVGFVVVRPSSEGWLLDHLYVLPAHQGQGHGAEVLRRVFADADARGQRLRVGALKGSRSNDFYQRHGFNLVESGDWDHYYEREPRSP